MNNTDKATARINPFQCTDVEALQAYERALQSYSKHAKDKINRFKAESKQAEGE